MKKTRREAILRGDEGADASKKLWRRTVLYANKPCKWSTALLVIYRVHVLGLYTILILYVAEWVFAVSQYYVGVLKVYNTIILFVQSILLFVLSCFIICRVNGNEVK